MLRSAILVLGVCGAAALPRRGAAFVSSRSAAMRPAQRRTAMPRTLQMSAAALPMPDAAQPAACGMSFSVKGKTVTPMGIWVGLMSFFWATAMCVAGVALFFEIARSRSARPRPLRSYPLLLFATGISMVFDKARRRPTDIVVRARPRSAAALSACVMSRRRADRFPGAMVGEARDALERLHAQARRRGESPVRRQWLHGRPESLLVRAPRCRAHRARARTLRSARGLTRAPRRAQLPRHLHALRFYAATAQVRVQD